MSAIDLANQLGLNVTARAVRKYLKERGFSYRKPAKKITLDQKRKDLRVDFCHKMKEFRLINSIVFSDEASFWLHDNDHCDWFLKDVNYELSVDRHSGKIHARATVSVKGKIELVTFTDNLDASFYQDILAEDLIPNAWHLYPKIWYFQQDNDSKHTAGSTQRFLKKNVPHTIAWPSRSPDLNLMENVWKILKGNIRKRLPKTIMEPEDCIHKEWNNLDNKVISNLARSFRNRIDECIRLHGDITHC